MDCTRSILSCDLCKSETEGLSNNFMKNLPPNIQWKRYTKLPCRAIFKEKYGRWMGEKTAKIQVDMILHVQSIIELFAKQFNNALNVR